MQNYLFCYLRWYFNKYLYFIYLARSFQSIWNSRHPNMLFTIENENQNRKIFFDAQIIL